MSEEKILKLMVSPLWLDFEKIRKAKLFMNRHKTLKGYDLKFALDKLRNEYIEMNISYRRAYLYLNINKTENEKLLLKQKFQTELADLANMCYLCYLKSRGYNDE